MATHRCPCICGLTGVFIGCTCPELLFLKLHLIYSAVSINPAEHVSPHIQEVLGSIPGGGGGGGGGVQQYSFMEIDHEIIVKVILSLLLM